MAHEARCGIPRAEARSDCVIGPSCSLPAAPDASPLLAGRGCRPPEPPQLEHPGRTNGAS
eukprot:7085666-Alexandrium_andersonii.AAC.1